MDISKKYIKMCDWTELQQKCTPYMENAFFRYNNKTIPIWLPSQDQWQEMIINCFPQQRIDFIALALDFSDWIQGQTFEMRQYTESFTSMEQLWMAFVMYKFHDKQWNGEKWN